MSDIPTQEIPELIAVPNDLVVTGTAIANDAGVGNLSLQEKDGDEEGEFGEDLGDLPRSVIKRLIALKQFQDESEKIDVQYKLERVLLEKKFRELKAPLWDKRFQVTSGAVEVETLLPGEEPGAVPEPESEEEKIVGIPGFWLQCIQNSNTIAQTITDEDQAALEFLKDIRCEYNEDMSGFKLVFVFDENPFFTNQELTKSYTVSPDLLDEKAPALTDVKSSIINWKDQQNLCETEIRKKQRAKSGRRAGQVRYVTQTEAKPSFFHYFKEPAIPDGEEDEEEDEEGPGKKSKFELDIDEDYEIGHIIRTAIIPEAVLWFTGEADDGNDDYDDDGEEEEDGDEEEDEDEEEDDPDEESEEVQQPAKSKKGKGGKGAAKGGDKTALAPGEQPPECKQN